MDALAETGLADPDQSCAPELVETYVHLRRPDDAWAAARKFSTQAEAKGQPWALARAQRALGMCQSSLRAERHFSDALQLHAQTADRYEAARTQLAFGSRLRRDRNRSQARPLLRSALESFEHLGATPWADRAASELLATGEHVHRREAEAMDELTSQERQIAQLLSEGRTTREAAAALFISPKTVEYHLRHVYLKLGIRSRASLAQLFASDGGRSPVTGG
jgi:DNA-binding CsgD family transcriptional regulator